MKKKPRILILCAAALMTGCMVANTVFAMPSQQLCTEEIVTEEYTGGHWSGTAEVVVLAAAQDDAMLPDGEDTGAQTSAETSAEEESGGFFSWYVGLFSNTTFIVGFVIVLCLVALIVLKTNFVASFRKKHKKAGKKTSHRTDGL